jgi:hypothetical protein
MHQPTKDGPSELPPVASPATELGVLPGTFFSGFKPLPLALIPIGRHLFDIFVHLAATDIADMKRLTQLKNLLIEKAAVHANDDRYVQPILSFDLDDHMLDHFQHSVTMIGMLVPTAKDCVDDESPPVHLQGLKPLFLFVGRFDAMTAQGIVIVHDHRVDTQLDHIGLGDLQPPEKKGLQKTPKQKSSCPSKAFKKSFNLMGRGHVLFWRLDTAGIAFIVSNLIKVCQPTACAINKEAQHLLEKLRYAKTFSVFPNASEPALDPAENLDLVQICNEQSQASPAGQSIRSGLDAPYFQFSSAIFFAMFTHRVLHLLGVAILAITLASFSKYYSILSNFRGLFLFRNRSI